MLILDQCLTDPAISFNDIYQIVDDPVFQPHHDIQIPQPDIGIDQNHALAQLRASPVPMFAVDVVFPTPPFPDVITITSLIYHPSASPAIILPYLRVSSRTVLLLLCQIFTQIFTCDRFELQMVIFDIRHLRIKRILSGILFLHDGTARPLIRNAHLHGLHRKRRHKAAAVASRACIDVSHTGSPARRYYLLR